MGGLCTTGEAAERERDMYGMEYVLRYGQAPELDLLTAAMNGIDTWLEQLLKVKDVDLNPFHPAYQHTPLIIAAQRNHCKCVQLLVAAGADVNLRDSHKRSTALMAAAYNGCEQCLLVLLHADADLDMQNKHGDTALIIARRRGHESCAKGLVQAGADVTIRNKFGETAMLRCLYDDSSELLLNKGADVNQVSATDGNTGLITTACDNDYRGVQLLLKAGAYVNILNNLGHNALQSYIYIHTDSDLDLKMLSLLYAAGETIDGTTVLGTDCTGKEVTFDEYLMPTDKIAPLKHMCRQRIRNHLLELNPFVNLFRRVYATDPLSRALQTYLVYNVSLSPPPEVKTDFFAEESRFVVFTTHNAHHQMRDQLYRDVYNKASQPTEQN